MRSRRRLELGGLGQKAAAPQAGGGVSCASGTPVLSLSFRLALDLGQAHDGGARRRRMASRIAQTIGPVTATSASWKVMARAWRTTRAPILTSLSCKRVSDQSAIASGSSIQRRRRATQLPHDAGVASPIWEARQGQISADRLTFR